MAEKKTIKVQQIKSVIGRKPKHRATMRGLGLTKMHKTVTLEDTPAVRGMIRQVSYMVRVIED